MIKNTSWRSRYNCLLLTVLVCVCVCVYICLNVGSHRHNFSCDWLVSLWCLSSVELYTHFHAVIYAWKQIIVFELLLWFIFYEQRICPDLLHWQKSVLHLYFKLNLSLIAGATCKYCFGKKKIWPNTVVDVIVWFMIPSSHLMWRWCSGLLEKQEFQYNTLGFTLYRRWAQNFTAAVLYLKQLLLIDYPVSQSNSICMFKLEQKNNNYLTITYPLERHQLLEKCNSLLTQPLSLLSGQPKWNRKHSQQAIMEMSLSSSSEDCSTYIVTKESCVNKTTSYTRIEVMKAVFAYLHTYS